MTLTSAIMSLSLNISRSTGYAIVAITISHTITSLPLRQGFQLKLSRTAITRISKDNQPLHSSKAWNKGHAASRVTRRASGHVWIHANFYFTLVIRIARRDVHTRATSLLLIIKYSVLDYSDMPRAMSIIKTLLTIANPSQDSCVEPLRSTLKCL